MNKATPIAEYASISATIQHYIQGAISGKGEDMKPAFHPDATIYGYIGSDLFAGPIQNLYDWNDGNGPANGGSDDISDPAATASANRDRLTGGTGKDWFLFGLGDTVLDNNPGQGDFLPPDAL